MPDCIVNLRSFLKALIILSVGFIFITSAQNIYAQQCGEPFSGVIGGTTYTNAQTECFGTSVGYPEAPDTYQTCPFLSRCVIASLQFNGICGQDTYTTGGAEYLTFCSNGFHNETVSGMSGCNVTESCWLGPAIGDRQCTLRAATAQERREITGGREVMFCISGFDSAAEIQNSRAEFKCVNNCGGVGLFSSRGFLADLISSITNHPTRGINYRGVQTYLADDGSFYTCAAMNISNEVEEAILWQVRTADVACTIGATGVALLIIPATGGFAAGTLALASQSIGVGLTSGFVGEACEALFADYQPTVQASVIRDDGSVACVTQTNIRLNYEINDLEIVNEEPLSEEYAICRQLNPNSQAFQDCRACSGTSAEPTNGIWTAVGCIRSDPQSIVGAVIRIGIGIAGGVALIMILAAGFMFTVSQGDPKRVGEARDLITSAVIGLLFIVFSVSILQFLGVQLLRIPGFGG